MVYFLCKAYDSDRQNCYFALSLPVRGAWIEITRRASGLQPSRTSLPVRGAWIEMTARCGFCTRRARRSPCGERGLKYQVDAVGVGRSRSLPVRGAWIEMPYVYISGSARNGRSPCGERGLKWDFLLHKIGNPYGRSPCGERGLK